MRPILLLSLVIFLSACAGQPYKYEQFNVASAQNRAVEQTIDNVTLKAFVPGAEEAERLFGIPIYERGIQPVWLQIENQTEHRARIAPTSLDSFYFSPLEVSYIHRKGFSKEARHEMDIRLYKMAMPRFIPAGETRSGFVFTHAAPGTKSFNVDIFSTGVRFRTFHMFYEVDGFKPDHAEVNFADLYDESQLMELGSDEFRSILDTVSCCATSHDGKRDGLPISVLIVSKGEYLLSTLLRGGWTETQRESRQVTIESAQHLFGRPPDSIFRYERETAQIRNEVRLWLTPARIDGAPVWAAQVIQFIGHRTKLQDLLFGSVFDPDMDYGRSFLMQNFWYNQGVRQIAIQRAGPASNFDDLAIDFNGTEYFTDGYRNIIWLSEVPVALNKIQLLDWDRRLEQP